MRPADDQPPTFGPKRDRRAFLRPRRAVESVVQWAERVVALGETPSPPGAEETYLVHFARRAMACQFQVMLNAGQYPDGSAAVLSALDLVETLEGQLTVFRSTSDVMMINRLAYERPVDVEPRLFALLALAAGLSDELDGALDITAGPLTKAWGFFERRGAIPPPEVLAAALARVGSRHLLLDAAAATVRFALRGMELNLGAIGKGYALDRAAELLARHGIDDYLMHGGQSSVLARGTRAGTEPGRGGWIVGVLDPLRPARRMATIRLVDQALSTSGAARQHFRDQGRRFGHILDPRSGLPAEGVLSATVVAPSATLADALSTAFYVLGRAATEEFCGRHPEIGALLVEARPHGGSRIAHWGLAQDRLQFIGAA